jgi:hypothetical protein
MVLSIIKQTKKKQLQVYVLDFSPQSRIVLTRTAGVLSM